MILSGNRSGGSSMYVARNKLFKNLTELEARNKQKQQSKKDKK